MGLRRSLLGLEIRLVWPLCFGRSLCLSQHAGGRETGVGQDPGDALAASEAAAAEAAGLVRKDSAARPFQRQKSILIRQAFHSAAAASILRR